MIVDRGGLKYTSGKADMITHESNPRETVS